jgi:hypothetical protein
MYINGRETVVPEWFLFCHCCKWSTMWTWTGLRLSFFNFCLNQFSCESVVLIFILMFRLLITSVSNSIYGKKPWSYLLLITSATRRFVPASSTFFFTVRKACRWRRVWSLLGMILKRENESTRKKTCLIASFSTINVTWTGPESKPGVCGVRPLANCVSHDLPLKH